MTMLRNGHGGLYKAPKGRKKKAKDYKEREMRSSLLIFDLNVGRL